MGALDERPEAEKLQRFEPPATALDRLIVVILLGCIVIAAAIAWAVFRVGGAR